MTKIYTIVTLITNVFTIFFSIMIVIELILMVVITRITMNVDSKEKEVQGQRYLRLLAFLIVSESLLIKIGSKLISNL